MTLEDLGYGADLEDSRVEKKLDSFGVGRIISEHKERYRVRNEKSEFEAEVVGNLRFTAQGRSDFPAVGDWVAISEYEENKVLIHAIFPRRTVIEREAVGKLGEKQIIATNIEYAFIVQAVDRDFNINRIERYLTICYAAGVKPIIVLNKTDLIAEAQLDEILSSVKERVSEVPIIAISNQTHAGYEQLLGNIKKGATYCLLGSSGVGKSTLMNNLSGRDLMQTGSISESTNKGRHVTSHRELIVLESGGIIIDNPGMREVGIADASAGLETTFETIVSLSDQCRFQDCTHVHESGCAIREAVESGEIDQSSYENYLKMEREKQHFESTVAERRKKDKEFGKMVKTVMKNKKK
jgi:ribosome biogenesis GTPase / thiamine phosphate phosphatase